MHDGHEWPLVKPHCVRDAYKSRITVGKGCLRKSDRIGSDIKREALAGLSPQPSSAFSLGLA